MVNTATPKSLEFTLPNDFGAQQIVHERICAQIMQCGPTRREEFCIRLALEEALTNAMKHGNKMHPDKKVFVKSTIEDSTVTIEIEDEGNGFVVEQLPDPTNEENLGRPSGRGVLLIRSFMDHVDYNEKGNLVVMSKELGSTSTELSD
ncbi:MAG: ATP-binding protein [Planctomycetaceae bacterium]